MAPIPAVAFVGLVWGSVALVLLVFGYELYAVVVDPVLDRGRSP